MEMVFTVAIIYICYRLTVDTHHRAQIRRLRNKVEELDELVNIMILYGKEKGKKDEAEKTE